MITSYQVLIVEDDKVQRMILDGYLKESEYEVSQAKNGAEALKMLEKYKPDVILMDVHMPVMDGFETLESIRNDPKLRDIPVLILSSQEKDFHKIKGLELGADDYITKPFNARLLISRIKAVLRRTERTQRPKGAMEGDLTNISLSDLMQNLSQGLTTGAIMLDDMSGIIYMENGSLMRVQQGAFTGSPALVRLLLLNRGCFSVRFGNLPDDIHGKPESFVSVLMNALAQVDEIKAIIKITGLENRIIKIKDNVAEDFPALEKVRKLTPADILELLTLMEGDMMENFKLLSSASKQGKLQMRMNN